MSRTHRIAFTGTLLLALIAGVSWAIATRGSRRVPMTREVAREMRSGAEFARRLDQTLATSPAESISVSDAVAGGYLCLALSLFKVHVLLGVLVALTMVTSSAATVAFLPSILNWDRPRGSTKSTESAPAAMVSSDGTC